MPAARSAPASDFSVGRGGRRGRRPLLRGERLEHARGVLAARGAEIEPRLLARREGVRITLAIIAALAAILLRHGRHHPSPQRSAFSELHARVEGQRLVVPGRLAVIGIGRLQERAALGSNAIGVTPLSTDRQAGEKSVEPAALLGGEGRRFRDEARRRGHVGHCRISASARRRIVAASQRRAKATKCSSSFSRCRR